MSEKKSEPLDFFNHLLEYNIENHFSTHIFLEKRIRSVILWNCIWKVFVPHERKKQENSNFFGFFLVIVKYIETECFYISI